MIHAAICARIAKALAAGTIHDNLGYEALAQLKLQGHDYYSALDVLHALLRPKLYIEIGTRYGRSLDLARPDTRCIAIDPEPKIRRRQDTVFAVSTSDNFFANEANRESVRGFDLAFIDGDHSFDQALRDFNNLEALAAPCSIIAIHDVIPMDERTSTPTAQSSFWTGDVWRLMAALVGKRHDLIAFTMSCPPTGLGIVGRFTKPEIAPTATIEAVMAEARDWAAALPFEPDWDRQTKLLNIKPNTGDGFSVGITGVR